MSSRRNCVSISLIYVCEMIDIQQTYCGNHFVMDVSQIMVLYTLNVYPVVCHLHLKKTGRR